MRRLVAFLVLGALVLVAAGCNGPSANKAGGHEQKALVLTLANGTPGDVDVGEWVQAVERLSNGSIRIEVHGDWRADELDGEAATIRDVRAGKIDLAKVPARAWNAVGVHAFDPLLAPFLVSTYDLERRVVSGELHEQMLSGVEQAGVVGIALLPGELQRPLGVTRDLLHPAAYTGAAIAARSTAGAAALRALGGRPRLVAGRLDLSAVDGAEVSLFSVDFDRYYQGARSVTTNVVLWPRALTIVMNRGAYKRLTPDERAILGKAAGAAMSAVMQRLRTAERGALQSKCRHRFRFVSASPADVDALRARVAPLIRRLRRDATTSELLDRIEKLKGPASSVERLGVCPRSRGRVAAASPLDGTWHSSATQDEFVAAHPLPGEFPKDNYGDYTLMFQQGRFDFRISRFSGSAGSGHFSIKGDVITFVPLGTIEHGAGEIWKYRWTLYRGTLVFRRVSDIGPTAFIVNPWSVR